MYQSLFALMCYTFTSFVSSNESETDAAQIQYRNSFLEVLDEIDN